MRRDRAAGERKPSPVAAELAAASHLGPRDPAPCGAVRCACALLVLSVLLGGPWGLSPRSDKGCEHGAGAERPRPSAARPRGWGWGAGMRALGYSRLLCPRKLVTSEPKFLPVGIGGWGVAVSS